ncbi:MAG: hypothetical protein ACI9Y7_001275 [Dokdonia sp.]|jgi:hypothetical protein
MIMCIKNSLYSIVSFLLLVSCASTIKTIDNVDKSIATQDEKQTLVIIALTINDEARTQFELDMQAALLSYDVYAISSSVYFDTEFGSYTKLHKRFSKMISAMDDQGYRNIMITMIAGVENIVAKNESNEILDKIYHLETQLYNLEGDTFFSHWKYCLHILESELNAQGISYYVKTIVKEMEEDLIITKKQKEGKKIPYTIWML